MSGSGTFAGTSFQAKTITLVYVHILAQRRLSWVPPADDTPLSVSGETGGPGDDGAIGFGDQRPPVEFQAKHGLKGGDTLKAEITKVATKIDASKVPVVLVVDSGVTKGIRQELKVDLDRMRSGRFDGLRPEATQLKTVCSQAALDILHIVAIDVDHESGMTTQLMISMLNSILKEPSQAWSALDTLLADANRLCAERRRHTRESLVQLLASKGVTLRPAQEDLHRRLDVSRDFLNGGRALEGIACLDHLEHYISTSKIDPTPAVQFRILCQRAAAALQLDNAPEALRLAQRALDYEPERIEAAMLAANAAAASSDVETAQRFVDRALKVAPHHAGAWGLAQHLRAVRGDAPTQAPPEVAEHPDYLLSILETAAMQGNHAKIKATVQELFQRGHRPPEALNHLAAALVESVIEGSDADGGALVEAQRVLSEVVESLHERDPRRRRALTIRAGAHLLSGRKKEADADLSQLKSLGLDDADLVNNLAVRRLHEGDPAGALIELQRPIVEKNPRLLLLRAQIYLQTSKRDLALRDFESASALISDSSPAEWLALQAEAAFDLGDPARAERILALLGDRTATEAPALLTKGRIAFQRGDVDGGVSCFRDAARSRPPQRQAILIELGGRLRRLDRFGEAIAVFSEAGGVELPDHGLREYAAALNSAGQLKEAQALVNALAGRGPLPEWAVNVALQIAITSGDVEAAITHLRTVIATRPDARAEARVTLARQFAMIGRDADALGEIRATLAEDGLRPVDRMQVAQILNHLGHVSESLDQAVLAYREDRGHQEINRILIHIALTIRSDYKPFAPVDVVGPDTHVVLTGKDSTREYTIWAAGPISAQNFELPLSEATRLGLAGKAVGDQVIMRPGDISEEVFLVTEVGSAVLHTINEALKNFEKRFPDDTSIRGFKAPDGESVGDWGFIISTLEERRKARTYVFETYRERAFPLGWAATMLGTSVRDVMATLSFSEPPLAGIATEWNDANEQSISCRVAHDATCLVLSQSALETASRLGVLELVRGRYELVTPHMLAGVLAQAAHDDAEEARKGAATFSGSDRGPEMRSLEAGHPLLVAKAEQSAKYLSWCKENTKVKPRPLQFLKTAPESDRMREMIGEESWDSLELALDGGIPIWCDDLGLRRTAIDGKVALGTSTISILRELRDAGTLSEADYLKNLQTLVQQRYLGVLPSVTLLAGGVSRYGEIGRSGVASVLGTLTAIPDVSSAAEMLAHVLRVSATASVEALPIEDLTQMGLEALNGRWPRQICARQLRAAAQKVLSLLPLPLLAIAKVCVSFSRREPPFVGVRANRP
jgi:tetratricopeptide (TPR) repeat protein